MMTTEQMKTDSGNMPWLKSYPKEIDWRGSISVRPVYEMMDETCRNFGARPAFDFLGRKWNWSEIGGMVDRLAKGLQAMGLEKGGRVAILLPNSPYFVVSYYATLKAGGTVVNLNPLYPVRELQHQIEDSGAEILITLDLRVLYDKAHEMLHSSRLRKVIVCPFTDILPFPKNILFRLARGKEIAKIEHTDRMPRLADALANDGKPEPVAIDPHEDIAVLQYTGGTTGTPKGAMLTHENIVANVEQTKLWFLKVNMGEEKMLGVLPFFHVFAMTAVMNLSVRCAFEIIGLPRFELEDTLKTIAKKRPHFFPAVPAIYNAINNYAKLKDFDLRSLRYCISGGAPLPVEVKKNFETNTGCVVVEGYGLTESSPVVCVNPVVGENRAGSIGLPMPGTIVEIVNMDDKKTLMPLGERGELCVRGPQVMKGYWNKPEETANVMRDGRLHTGDIAIMDEDGYVYIVDRLKDMIITNGYNVYPRNVEEAIYLHAGVEECIVAGLPDSGRGEIVKAWIKPKAGHTLITEDMKEFLQDKLSPMEIPRLFEFRYEPLPKTMIGKLSRKDILEQEMKRAGG